MKRRNAIEFRARRKRARESARKREARRREARSSRSSGGPTIAPLDPGTWIRRGLQKLGVAR